MRFKPRFDMERLLECINENNYGKMDKNFFERVKKEYDNSIKRINNDLLEKNDKVEMENYEQYVNFVKNTNKFSILRGIKNKNLDTIYQKNEKLNKKQSDSAQKTPINNKYKPIKLNKNKNNNTKIENEDELNDDNFSDIAMKKNSLNKFIKIHSKSLLSDLHLKTHFKATCVLANNTRQEILNKNKNKNRISPIKADYENNSNDMNTNFEKETKYNNSKF
jgi:hypothetical protein